MISELLLALTLFLESAGEPRGTDRYGVVKYLGGHCEQNEDSLV